MASNTKRDTKPKPEDIGIGGSADADTIGDNTDSGGSGRSSRGSGGSDGGPGSSAGIGSRDSSNPAAEAEGEAPAISVEETEGIATDGFNPMAALFGAFAQTAQTKPKKRTGKARQANETVEFAVTVVDNIAQAAIDPEAGMLDIERFLIVEGITDQIEHNDAAVKFLTKTTGPTALFFGVALWGARCFTIWSEKHPRKPKPPNGGPRVAFPLVPPPIQQSSQPFMAETQTEPAIPSQPSPNGAVFTDTDLSDLMSR